MQMKKQSLAIQKEVALLEFDSDNDSKMEIQKRHKSPSLKIKLKSLKKT